MDENGPTLRDHYALSERITRLEAQMREVSELQRKALYVIVSAVIIAILKGAGVI